MDGHATWGIPVLFSWQAFWGQNVNHLLLLAWPTIQLQKLITKDAFLSRDRRALLSDRSLFKTNRFSSVRNFRASTKPFAAMTLVSLSNQYSYARALQPKIQMVHTYVCGALTGGGTFAPGDGYGIHATHCSRSTSDVNMWWGWIGGKGPGTTTYVDDFAVRKIRQVLTWTTASVSVSAPMRAAWAIYSKPHRSITPPALWSTINAGAYTCIMLLVSFRMKKILLFVLI
jgi:hypothetical protein